MNYVKGSSCGIFFLYHPVVFMEKLGKWQKSCQDGWSEGWDVNSGTPEYKTRTPEESSLLGCDTMLLDEWLLTFQRNHGDVIFKGQQCKKTARYCTRMKHHEPHNWWHSITSQKPQFLSNTATRTSNLAEAWYIWPQCLVVGSCCLKCLVLG